MRKQHVWWIAFAVSAVAMVLSGCQTEVTPIKTLLDDPGRFDTQSVRISGTVGNSFSVLNYGAYQVDDGTGTITVVSQKLGAPRQGATVGVAGEFRAAFTLGAESAAVVMEKERFTP